MTHDVAAAGQARAALARGERSAVHFNTLAWDRAVSGDATGAEEFFRQSLALRPHGPEALVGLAGLAREAGRLSEAVRLCDAALAADANYPEAWLERAFVMHAGGSMPAARECYAQAIALRPGDAAAHAGLASLGAREGLAEEAREHAAAALATDPDNAIAAAALATIAIEEGEPERARALLEPLAARRPRPDAERVQLLNVLGDACAKLGDADAAHSAYARSKSDFAALHAPHFSGRRPHRCWIEDIAAAIDALDPSAWGRFEPAGRGRAPRHVFVLGYPRSGNTLLENILASLPGVVALEERATLRAADLAFLADPASDLPRLQSLDDNGLASYRQAYWDQVAAAGLAPLPDCFVDMDPLKGTRLPLIARLFPQARVIFLRRDPRDVVWSCFHTSFALTNAAMDFTTIEGTARHYAALMTLIEKARARLPLTVLDIDYRDLVRDFDATTRAICEFAGLTWSEELRRFDRTAKARGVATASASQVRKGLYDGSGQWRPFARWLEPVMPILSPWIERFGYSD